MTIQKSVRVIRKPESCHKLGICPAAFYEHISRGLLPKPIKLLGGRSSGWLESEIDAVIAALAAGKSEEEIKTLVVDLEAARVAQPEAA